MKSIIEALEEEIPHGPSCYGCTYFEIKNMPLGHDVVTISKYCNFLDEFMTWKICEINE